MIPRQTKMLVLALIALLAVGMGCYTVAAISNSEKRALVRQPSGPK